MFTFFIILGLVLTHTAAFVAGLKNANSDKVVALKNAADKFNK